MPLTRWIRSRSGSCEEVHIPPATEGTDLAGGSRIEVRKSVGESANLDEASLSVDLAEFVALQKTFAESAKSWMVDAGSVDQVTFDLSVKNPNATEAAAHRSPLEILDEIVALDAESADVLARIRALV